MKNDPFRVLFLLSAVLVLAGLISCLKPLASAGLGLVTDLANKEADSVERFKKQAEDITSLQLLYHDALMDLNAARENLLGTRIIEKEDLVLVKTDAGRISEYFGPVSAEDILFATEQICQLQQFAEAGGAAFLYCAVPRKALYETFPANITNHEADNFLPFLSALKEKNVPVLNLADYFDETGLGGEDIFFATDHHWKATAAFSAAGGICRRLAQNYGFLYEDFYADIQNYTVTTYPRLFLGSLGKKTGSLFASPGSDDFDLILPNFETYFSESRPLAKMERQGSFEETLLFKENLEKDYYKINCYAAYCGGDFRLQIIKNNLKPQGAKILLIRDSFACAAAPFLALQAGELHICDIRNFESFVGNKISIKDYIEAEKPDYVLVLYGGVSSRESAAGQYDFLD